MHIESVRFEDKELQPAHIDGKKIQYDIYCTTSAKEHFIVEMQQANTENFPERILFYLSKAIVNQGIKGATYMINPVYCIVLTNFDLSHMQKSLLKDIVLMERQTHEVYSEKARLIFLSLAQVPRRWNKCDTELLRLLFLIKNMDKLTKHSKPYLSGEYDEIFTASATGNLTNEEAIAYSQSYYRQLEDQSALVFAEKEGEAKGIASTARNLKNLGAPLEMIMKATGLTAAEIEAL